MFTHEFELQLDLKSFVIGPYITKNVVIILAAFAAGAVVAVIFGVMQSISSSSESKEKSRRIRELEARNRELIEERQREEKLKKPEASPFGPPSAIDSSSHGS
ncbi:MAG: lipopolysaccharide assembly protein LapA domain-containing protein [Candidatus Dadabacteria bacterium]|nr:lipopolysaccharide assembly protein LapA domain-containing protein [Candidatus Dadabacteria bacterium]